MVLTLCGDISITQHNRRLWENTTVEKVFGKAADLFHASDRVIINLECALTEADTAIRKFGPNLKGPAVAADILKEAGVTDCGLSNNHICDFGRTGLDDTLKELNRVGLNYTGIGENEEDSRKDLIITQDGKTVRIITVCEHEYSYAMPDFYGARPYDPYDTAEDIRIAKASSDYVIVMYHGGKEQCHYPSPRLYKACHAMVKSGADVVLCQHSHCIGTYEQFEGGHILYGQGNFHFAKEAYREKYEDWHEGLILQYDTDANTLDFVPLMAQNGCIRLANAEEKERILAAFRERSKSLQDGTWRDGWHAFCEQHRDAYTRPIAKAFTAEATESNNEMFAHYLDCEAHTDVWKELFPTYNVTDNK